MMITGITTVIIFQKADTGLAVFLSDFSSYYASICCQLHNRSMHRRGLQCFKLNGNQTENDRYWQKNSFLLFAKCLKMYSFFSLFHLKYAKSAIITQTIFFWKISIWVTKKRRILCLFQIRWCRLKQMPLKKARAKKLCKFWVFRFCAFFRGFLLLTFVEGISESRHQRIWNQHKILRFFDTYPILIFFKEKIFWVIIALFAYCKCKCEKNCTFSNILQKEKSYFFDNIYHSPFDSNWNSKKSIKLKPPNA